MRLRVLLAPVLALGLGACDGGPTNARDEEQSVVATKSDMDVATWLAPTDAIDTARWLASREADHLVGADDPTAARLHRVLARAKPYFIEDPRMIANRTAQLGQMLAETGQRESYGDLIESLTAIAAAGRGKQLYGEMCQHYLNTRNAGSDRAAARARLIERYGAQRTGETQP
ncbi:hypothetical protein [Methylobacterium planeticum]|uniref:MxaH protein n=1 Tax=Methylobacterium planeticum TaxID=2615211 RepID=A0A6N6MSE3_9HYPH|nr:hypothetical protein [Methylobacterium planeticum]KAB1074457.1 hypothetical protein F6X51_08850 [Methylobacterium planeticum]